MNIEMKAVSLEIFPCGRDDQKMQQCGSKAHSAQDFLAVISIKGRNLRIYNDN